MENSSFACGCPTRLAKCSFLSFTQYTQLRRRNDGVECRALRGFGHGRCPETPHRFDVHARAETPHRERPSNIPTPRRLERLKQFGYYVDMMMFKYRVTKYDPRNRDNEGTANPPRSAALECERKNQQQASAATCNHQTQSRLSRPAFAFPTPHYMYRRF